MEVRFKGRHGELHIASRFVKEMPQDSPRYDVRTSGMSFPDGGLDDGHAAILLQLRYKSIPHLVKLEETFLVCTDQDDGQLVILSCQGRPFRL